MNLTVKVDLGGVDEKLHNLGAVLAKRALRKAFRAVAVFWVEQVRSRVPVLSGDLRNSIGASVRTNRDEDGGSVTVGPAFDMVGAKDFDQDPGYYGEFVEFGRMKGRPMPQQPFMRPTFDATAEKAVAIFADVLKAEVEKLGER